MPLASLAARTDAWFLDEVRSAGPDATALRCPSDPLFRWGNLLVLDAPPEPGRRGDWEARFAVAFADVPAVRHATFAWTGEDGARAEFMAAGYAADTTVVRTASADDLASVRPPPPGFALRRVSSEADWATVHALHLADTPSNEDPTEYARHRSARMAVYRAITRGERPSVRGGWYLATIDGAPAGSLGVFAEDDLGRFQYVHVAAPFRRRGIATTMVHQAAREGFGRWGARRLVILADEGEPADAIYARLGFAAVERYVGVCTRDLAAVRAASGR